MVQMAGAGAPEFESPPILKPERDAVLSDRPHLGRAAVHEPETCVVPGPADAVARAEFHVLDAIGLDLAGPVGEPVWVPNDDRAVLPLTAFTVPAP